MYNFLFFILFTVLSFQTAYAVNAPSTDSGESQDQSSFPFDNQCLKFDKANFKVGQALLEVMKTGDFPQYCVLYSLSNYQVKEKREDGYLIIGSKLEVQQAEATKVFLKSNKNYSISKPVGQWAYFVGPERFTMENGVEKEYYVFQEIDLENKGS